MKYLLFDQNAISVYVCEIGLQSVEYQEGLRFIEHIRGVLSSENFYNTRIEYTKDGILFVGPKNTDPLESDANSHVICFDLTTCKLLEEEANNARVLTVMQKAFRLALKIWKRNPFSASERINGTKSILFPFSIGDRHRLVIERSNSISRLGARGIEFPLLAYKYNAEEPGQMIEVAGESILRLAGETYAEQRHIIRSLLEKDTTSESDTHEYSLEVVETELIERRDDFIYWNYDQQLKLLTEPQRRIVEFDDVNVPIRVDGAAGTGKTVALIMRAYRLLLLYRRENREFHIIFFAHSESTSQRNKQVFSSYTDSEYFLQENSKQSIQFITLLSYCRNIAKIDETSIVETNASEAKDYQLMIIDDIVKRARERNLIRTYWSLISAELKSLFDESKTNPSVLVNMLQHEFSVQIKGRTDCSIENYLELESIPNGIPCSTNSDKELVFALFAEYQRELQSQGTFDIDDVTIEAISHLNAPIWRRRRLTNGFDYIMVDEMHLFNLNEQSVFHFLSKDASKKEIPLCFAIDYSQSIGDLGDTSNDYISSGKFGTVNEHSLGTLFRNSPMIAEFCASIAASGTLMFGASFKNPYRGIQSQFTQSDEKKMMAPILNMYTNDNAMIADLKNQLSALMKTLQCKQKDIAIVTFDNRWITNEGIHMIESVTQLAFQRLSNERQLQSNEFIITTPYDINGLEFKAVVMLGADEGRVPQTSGTSDISRHFIMYSAYNLIYLTASRAKYGLIIMGSELNGISSCLEHSISAKTISVGTNSNALA